MKIKDLIDLKGCYSAHDVGEKELDLKREDFTMKIEKQVCSLELSKRLKELGVEQDSLYYWHNDKAIVNPNTFYGVRREKHICSAFTVAELGEMLPYKFYSTRDSGWREKDKDRWHCHPVPVSRGRLDLSKCADTEANVRAKMLIHLIENKLLEVKNA